MLENTGTPALSLTTGRRLGQLPPGSLTPEGLTQMPSVSSLPPRLTLLLWPAGRQDFWKFPKELLAPCVPQSLSFPPNSCLNRLYQNKTSGRPAEGGSPALGNVAPNPVRAQVEMLDCKGLEKP